MVLWAMVESVSWVRAAVMLHLTIESECSIDS